MATNKHIAAAGETWDSIAFKYYSDEFKASLLMDNNPLLLDKLVFEGGEVLNIPEISEQEKSDTLPPWRQTSEA